MREPRNKKEKTKKKQRERLISRSACPGGPLCGHSPCRIRGRKLILIPLAWPFCSMVPTSFFLVLWSSCGRTRKMQPWCTIQSSASSDTYGFVIEFIHFGSRVFESRVGSQAIQKGVFVGPNNTAAWCVPQALGWSRWALPTLLPPTPPAGKAWAAIGIKYKFSGPRRPEIRVSSGRGAFWAFIPLGVA